MLEEDPSLGDKQVVIMLNHGYDVVIYNASVVNASDNHITTECEMIEDDDCYLEVNAVLLN